MDGPEMCLHCLALLMLVHVNPRCCTIELYISFAVCKLLQKCSNMFKHSQLGYVMPKIAIYSHHNQYESTDSHFSKVSTCPSRASLRQSSNKRQFVAKMPSGAASRCLKSYPKIKTSKPGKRVVDWKSFQLM